MPLDRVVQIHLAGHANQGTHIIDTHDGPVIDPVWTMYQYVVKKAGRTPNTMIEWDDKIPEFPVLFAELEKAREAARTAAYHGPLPDLKKTKDVTPFDTQTDFEGALTRMQDAILVGHKAPSTAQAWIRSKEDFAPEAQLGVYIKGYRLRLNHLTKNDYPALELYLGEEAFQRLLTDFVEVTSSDHFNIARYSAKFPDFLKSQLPQDIFAHELCALENALTQLADEAETIPLAPHHLEGVTPLTLMEMHLLPRRALALLTFTHDIDAYFSAFMDNLPLPTPDPTPSYIAVFRHEGDMWRLPLEKDEYIFLQALFSGKTVGEAFEALPEDFDQEKISVWFSRWISNSMLAWQEASTS
ncbi:MAG: hypothetical protein C0514_07360 [Candidatus Puniceispirillum sp.]|nr:hypothetical protein [Candidatus Puniceispirillum sp.]